MEMLLDFCYYITLFLAPLALYSLFRKHDNQQQSKTNKDWFYVIKKFFARAAIKRYQNKCKRTLDDTSKQALENPKEIKSPNHSDSHFVHGVDQKGNGLTLRFVIRSELIAEVFVCLRLSNGAIYTFPGETTTRQYRLAGWQWKTKDLHLEILEPFKRIRVTYNGLLSNANRDVEHVHFSFIWTAAAAPKFYPQDASTSLLTQALAVEKWKDGDWIALLGDERGYGQFGALRGFVRGDSFPDDLLLNLPSSRTRFWGTSEKISAERGVHLFVAGRDGTLFNLWVKSLKYGCKGLICGNLITNTSKILPIDDSDIRLESLGQHGTLPAMFTVHVTAQRKTYRTVFHVNLKMAVENKLTDVDQATPPPFDLSNVPADCDLNAQQAKSLVDFWYAHKEPRLELPPPLLLEKTLETWPKCYVSSFSDENSRISRLTGGKGCSLALLSSVNSDDFTVPDGFIVTVNAFNRQLDLNFNMKKAVAILDDICCGRTGGDLEQACAATVKVFQNEEILPDIKRDIVAALTNVRRDVVITDDRWAVRSSAVGEDSEELSAAGQNETFLGCTSPGDVIEAVSKCWASLFTYQSVQYRHQHGLGVPSEMAVVVQRMVPADCAGVLFTCHPSTANPAQIVITANHGLGESVVSGRSEPDTIVLQRTFDNDLTVSYKTAGTKQMMIRMGEKGVEKQEGLEGFSISDNQALDLGRVGVLLEEAFGGARDIEWAYYQGRLFLLQARPVTTNSFWSDEDLLHEFDVATLTDDTVYTIANIGEVLPGAISLLGLTTTIDAVEKSLQRSIHKEVDHYILRCMPTYQHHMFLDVINSIHKNAFDTINMTSKSLDLAIFGHPVIDETIHSLAVWRYGIVGRLQNFKNLVESVQIAIKNEANLKKIKSLASLELGLNSARDTFKEMYDKIDRGIKTAVDVMEMHCYTTRTSVTYQIIAMNVLAENHQDFTLDHYNDVAMLLSSCDEVISAEIPSILSSIAHILSQNKKNQEFATIEPKAGQSWLKTNCEEASIIFEKFLQDHGHRTLGEFDIINKTWAMEPSEVVKMIQANCKKSAPKQEKTIQSVDDVIKNLSSPKSEGTRKFLKFLMKRNRRAVGVREQSKSECVRFCDKLRQAYRQLAHKMARAGLIPNEDLIFHLTHHEVGEIIKSCDPNGERRPGLISKALRRQKLHPKWNQLKFPEMSYGTPQHESRDIIVRTGGAGVKCQGTPACAGVIQARACVIRELSEIDQLRNGDVLITYCTDIGWSPYFPMLAGIVTELGGLVSHGAVIAREYGLPCIVGAKEATRVFKTGDVVVLSGKTGTIELVE